MKYARCVRCWTALHAGQQEATGNPGLVALQDGTQKSQKVFVIVPTAVGATEAEEIGTLHHKAEVCPVQQPAEPSS